MRTTLKALSKMDETKEECDGNGEKRAKTYAFDGGQVYIREGVTEGDRGEEV